MKNTELKKIHNNPLIPNRLNDLVTEVLDEDPAYVADELVELSEEILLQLSAIGMSIYLNQSNQKDVFNDFIIDLFTTKSHSYNAGPLYKWTAHMVKDLEGDDVSLIKPFFWSKGEQKEMVLNPDLIRLSELRNAVMHGFFILPAERNQAEAEHLASLLKSFADKKIFKLNSKIKFHFLSFDKELYSFIGDWTIDPSQWIDYSKCDDFGKLSMKIQFESSEEYELEQQKLIEGSVDNNRYKSQAIEFINSNDKGALGIWRRPNQNLEEHYSTLSKSLNANDQLLTIFQSLEALGINFTADFLINRLVGKIAFLLGEIKYSKNNKKALVQLRKKCDKKIIVVLNNVHIGLFNSGHILSLFSLFYENNIQIVAYGIHHPYLDQFFNSAIKDYSNPYHPDKIDWEIILSNYLRFKGPNSQVADQKEAYILILKITQQAISDLEKGLLVARQFANKYKFPMEFVHEVFDAISPYYVSSRQSFEIDIIDELYDFPKELTEASRVLFSLGRRDTKLEYQNKTLKI
jgi:hypothetical protein